jgi:hypothetical protein
MRNPRAAAALPLGAPFSQDCRKKQRHGHARLSFVIILHKCGDALREGMVFGAVRGA